MTNHFSHCSFVYLREFKSLGSSCGTSRKRPMNVHLWASNSRLHITLCLGFSVTLLEEQEPEVVHWSFVLEITSLGEYSRSSEFVFCLLNYWDNDCYLELDWPRVIPSLNAHVFVCFAHQRCTMMSWGRVACVYCAGYVYIEEVLVYFSLSAKHSILI